MLKLAKVITPFHKDLRIPKAYHYECPWPAAQTHIYMINVYKVCGQEYLVNSFFQCLIVPMMCGKW
jgi:hypothetical protein